MFYEVWMYLTIFTVYIYATYDNEELAKLSKMSIKFRFDLMIIIFNISFILN